MNLSIEKWSELVVNLPCNQNPACQHAACLISASGTHPRRRHSSQKRANWRSKPHGKERESAGSQRLKKKKTGIVQFPHSRNGSKHLKMKKNENQQELKGVLNLKTFYTWQLLRSGRQVATLPPLQPHRPGNNACGDKLEQRKNEKKRCESCWVYKRKKKKRGFPRIVCTKRRFSIPCETVFLWDPSFHCVLRLRLARTCLASWSPAIIL